MTKQLLAVKKEKKKEKGKMGALRLSCFMTADEHRGRRAVGNRALLLLLLLCTTITVALALGSSMGSIIHGKNPFESIGRRLRNGRPQESFMRNRLF